MPDWAIWFIVAAALIAGELAITAAILGPMGVAAFGAGVVAAAGGSSELQIVAFIIMTLLALVVARPIAKKHLYPPPPPQRTNAPALVGLQALVLEHIDRDRGQVKIEGDVWSARSSDPQVSFEPGERVMVDSVHRTIVHVSRAGGDEPTHSTSSQKEG